MVERIERIETVSEGYSLEFGKLQTGNELVRQARHSLIQSTVVNNSVPYVRT